jgi:hypothetical protein
MPCRIFVHFTRCAAKYQDDIRRIRLLYQFCLSIVQVSIDGRNEGVVIGVGVRDRASGCVSVY